MYLSPLQKILPLSEFKKSTLSCLKEVEGHGTILILTRHGRGAFVVQGIEMYSETLSIVQQIRRQAWIDDTHQVEDDYSEFAPSKSSKNS